MFRVPTPAQWYGSSGSTPFPSICTLLAAFLRSSLVFARSLQHFWLPASHLLGTCYLLETAYVAHILPQSTNVLPIVISYKHVLCIYFLFTTCVLWQDHMCLIYSVPTLHSNDTIHTIHPNELWPYIPYLSYLSCTPHIPYIWNIIIYHTYHTYNTKHTCHTYHTYSI